MFSCMDQNNRSFFLPLWRASRFHFRLFVLIYYRTNGMYNMHLIHVVKFSFIKWPFCERLLEEELKWQLIVYLCDIIQYSCQKRNHLNKSDSERKSITRYPTAGAGWWYLITSALVLLRWKLCIYCQEVSKKVYLKFDLLSFKWISLWGFLVLEFDVPKGSDDKFNLMNGCGCFYKVVSLIVCN